MSATNIRSFVFDRRMRYVVANILVTALTFLRNLAFMKRLGLEDLGQVALAQTIIMLISFLQFGLINGGYRIYSSGNSRDNENVNNSINTYILMLGCLVLLVISLGGHPPAKFSVRSETLYFSLAAGIATIGATWYNNCLIGDGELGLSNTVNLTSAILSLGLVLLPGDSKLRLGLLSLFLQPFCLICLTLAIHKPSRPSRLRFSLRTMQQILALGLIPFFAGILTLLNFQLERWSIISVMGPASLGQFYLVIIYFTAFAVVPNSLSNIYFPNAVRAHDGGDRVGFQTILRRYLKILGLYIVFVLLFTILFMKIVIAAFLPKFLGTIHLVYLVLPGLVAVTLCDVISLYFNSLKRLSPLLVFGLFSLSLYGALLWTLRVANIFSLESVVIARSGAGIASGVLLYLLYRVNRVKKIL